MNLLRQFGILNRQGMNAFNEGKPGDALFQLMQAAQLAHQMKSVLHEAKVHNNMALVHQGSGDNDKALVSFKKAEELAIEGAGEGNVLHRTIARNMAKLEQAA